MSDASKEIMGVVKEIKEKNLVESLGHEIMNGIEGYDTEDMGAWVLHIFEKYPENADILDEMLKAICDWSLIALYENMKYSERV